MNVRHGVIQLYKELVGRQAGGCLVVWVLDLILHRVSLLLSIEQWKGAIFGVNIAVTIKYKGGFGNSFHVMA